MFVKKGFVSEQKTFQPTIKNESIIDDHQIESHKEFTSDLKEAASIDARIAEFSLVREHSVLEESGIQKGVSILQESGLTRESMLNEFDSVTGSTAGANGDFEQQLRSAVAEARGMASNGFCEVAGLAVGVAGATGGAGAAGPFAGLATTKVCKWLSEQVDEAMDENHRKKTGGATPAENDAHWAQRAADKEKPATTKPDCTKPLDPAETPAETTGGGQTTPDAPMSVPSHTGGTRPEVDNQIGDTADPHAVQRMN